MTDIETAEIIASAVRCLDCGTDKHVFATEDAHCGTSTTAFRARVVRLALIEIVGWLAYVGRGGKNISFLEIRGPGVLVTLTCVLASGGKLSQLFHLTDNKLHWKDEISTEARIAAALYVASNHKPTMHH